jgi:hypothetical protein
VGGQLCKGAFAGIALAVTDTDASFRRFTRWAEVGDDVDALL